jgi:hypothetical protein
VFFVSIDRLHPFAKEGNLVFFCNEKNKHVSKGGKNNILSMWKWVYQGHVHRQGLNILL